MNYHKNYVPRETNFPASHPGSTNQGFDRPYDWFKGTAPIQGAKTAANPMGGYINPTSVTSLKGVSKK